MKGGGLFYLVRCSTGGRSVQETRVEGKRGADVAFADAESTFRSPDSHHYPVVLDLINIEAYGGDGRGCDLVHVLKLGLAMEYPNRETNTTHEARLWKLSNTARHRTSTASPIPLEKLNIYQGRRICFSTMIYVGWRFRVGRYAPA